MTWRSFNGWLAATSAVLTVIMVGLWIGAWLGGFIGDTSFIGHVSMLALVLATASMTSGAIAAWRSDVPTNGGDQ